MKLVTYSQGESNRPGILTDGGIIDIVSVWGESDAPRSVKDILVRGPSCLQKLADLAESGEVSISADSVKLLAPIPQPGKLLALAGNYAKHIIEAGMKLGLSDSPRFTTVPRPFLMPPTVIAGPGDEIPWPQFSETIDYEIELAIVMGKRAKRIDAEQASAYIAGYTIANDISARTVTFKKDRAERPWDEFYDWLNGKWADGFCPMGPYILTADEIEDAQNLNLRLTVNGRERQNSNTSQMIHPVVEIVAFISHLMTLEPGDVIATGTPSGVGMATGDYLEAGDRIEATIENLGTLANTLGARPEEFYHPLTKMK